MKIEQVAIQYYTLRDFTKTEEDFTETCRKVRDIGFKAIQISAIGPIEAENVRRIAADHGLTICATHEGGKAIVETPETIISKLERMGVKYTAYPYPHDMAFLTDKKACLDFCAQLEAAGKVFRQSGKVLTYHNHHIEFMKIEGKTVLDIIIENTSAENVGFELDTYWVQYGGASNVELAQRLHGRLPLLHMKDFKITPERQIAFSEIGQGNLNFKSIIAAAEAAGCEWFIVEQDSCPGDPFDSIKMSFDYIQANLVS